MSNQLNSKFLKRSIAFTLSALGLLLFIVSIGSASPAQPEVKSYIVVMELNPVIAYEGEIAKLPATKPGKGNKVNPNSAKVKKYQSHLISTHEDSLADAGASNSQKVHDYTIALNGYSALLTEDQAKAIKSQVGVRMVMDDELRQLTTESSPGFLDLDGPAGAWATGYDGEGVVVGVIDSGIWPEHPSFADDGSFAAPPVTLDGSVYATCDFGNTAHNPNDAPFTCNNKLIGARQILPTYRAVIGADPDEFDSARDDDGHGTHTASTAAGNAGVTATVLGINRGTVSGIAPRAHVIAYKGLGNLGGFGSDLAAAIDQAVADGVDVINYSVGGGPSLTGADDIAYLFAADAGVFVATSAGNSGPGAGTVGGPGSVPWITTVGASTQPRSFQGSASSSDGWEFFGVSITGGTAELPLIDAEDAGDALCNPGALDPSMVAGKIVYCKRGAIARVAKGYAVYLAGGAGMILSNQTDGQALISDTHWLPSVHINDTDGNVVKAYIDSAGASAVAQINGGAATIVDAPKMAGFSSRGSNVVAEDIIKPDITAPGVQILAGGSPFPDAGSVPGELFQAIAGTSMSSPHIAGIFALIKQAHPDWTPAMAKSAIMTTAYQEVAKEDGSTPADPFDFGAGHVNPGSPVHKGSAFQPGLVYDAGFLEYLGFLCDAEPSALSPTTCPGLASAGIPTDASDLNLASIGIAELPGSQTIERTVTSVANENGWRTYNVSVDAPPGYTVSVSPSSFKIKKGQTRTYSVTITNDGSAPIGQWAFGSLTWSDSTGHYDVRSPIAVRATLFNSPASVLGSGDSGNASFGVTFGYSGDYSAAAHGLEAANIISDSVVQDPDQAFSPSDGFSNLHTINTSGAAYLRIAMPPEAVNDPAVDIDIFVFDPSLNLVASSTSGGTDEIVNIALPDDGTWYVFVHGWQTAGASADYDLYTWVVSATPGGNMTVDSAPTAAVIGSNDTIDVSWTGATAGEWHLGAVSHSDASGLIGLTLVEVDNR
ncbi:MAG: S8 family serine peptidase [Anaerolineae bacterium]